MNAVVSWNADTDADLAGYHVYVGTTYDQPTDTVTWDYFVTAQASATSFSFGGLANRDTWFAVTAFDTSNNESLKSLIVSKRQLAQLLMCRMG